MSKRMRTVDERETLRQEIMDAAREMFVAEGYERVSMRKIAAHIGYSPTAIYLYFNDKADLFHQICEQAFARLARNLTAIGELSVSPLEKLRLGMREYINFGLKHPSHYRLVFGDPPKTHRQNKFRGSQGEAAFSTLVEAVTRCIDAGLLRDTRAEAVSQALWTSIHGLTVLLITHSNFPFVDRVDLIETHLDILIHGVRS